MNSDCGFLYAATGERHLREAAHSAASARRFHPELPTLVYTSAKDLAASGDWLRNSFQQIEIHPQPVFSFRDKIQPLLMSPFRRTLFLDGDTELLGRVDDVFDLLGKFPLAYCRDTTRYNLPSPMVPAVFSEPNTGVLAFLSGDLTAQLFRSWLERYDEGLARHERDHGTGAGYHDQPAFRQVLYESALPHYVLPEEYNLRAYALWYAGARVRILHAREPYLSRWRHAINRSEDMRYGDGETWAGRSVISLKSWVKHRLLGRSPNWLKKESLNKTYQNMNGVEIEKEDKS
ncbi:MAG: glycosyltransferase [Verrucomicrobia bacterium]|nr:glycosyltransferase [Verrucomicrobiota bacterium]